LPFHQPQLVFASASGCISSFAHGNETV
jgi:hypothetical protein